MTSDDLVGAGDRWIPQDAYDSIKARVPIVSVDFIPLSDERLPRIGLILRETYNGNRGWCVIGGAVLRNEPLSSAVERHVSATLGDDVIIDIGALRLLGIFEYFTEPGLGDFYDPRKHSVAPTYFGQCRGSIRARGEALEFRWFMLEELPEVSFGFGQEKLIECLVRTHDLDHFRSDS